MASGDVKYSSGSGNDAYDMEKAKVSTNFCYFIILFDISLITKTVSFSPELDNKVNIVSLLIEASSCS